MNTINSMKRSAALVFVVVMFIAAFSTAFADQMDWSAMSAVELQQTLSDIHAALNAKTLDVGSNKVIIGKEDHDGYQLSLGKIENLGNRLKIYFTIINDSTCSVGMQTYSISVNGWYLGWNSVSQGRVTSGERSKNTAHVEASSLQENADVTSIEDIDIIRCQISLIDIMPDDSSYFYCTFYLVSDGNGGFVVSSALTTDSILEADNF